MLGCAETEIPSETDVIAKASNNVINNMDFNLATKEGSHETDQAGCGRTEHGETRKLQARLDEITRKRDGIKKDVSDRDTRMRTGEAHQRVCAVKKEAWSHWFGKKVQSVHREPRF